MTADTTIKPAPGALTDEQKAELLDSAIGELADVSTLTRGALGDLECAESVESMSDWSDNLANAEDQLKSALKAIKAARDAVRLKMLEMQLSNRIEAPSCAR